MTYYPFKDPLGGEIYILFSYLFDGFLSDEFVASYPLRDSLGGKVSSYLSTSSTNSIIL